MLSNNTKHEFTKTCSALLLLYNLQPFLPDLGLEVTATAMPFLELFNFWVHTFFLRIVQLTNSLRFAMSPDSPHAGIGIVNVTNFL